MFAFHSSSILKHRWATPRNTVNHFTKKISLFAGIITVNATRNKKSRVQDLLVCNGKNAKGDPSIVMCRRGPDVASPLRVKH